MKDEFEEIIEIPNEGVYRVQYKHQSLKALKNRKSRLESKAREYRQKIDEAKSSLAYYSEKLKEITKINFDDLIKKAAEFEAEAQRRSDEFLAGWIGAENFESLKKKGHFIFVGYNGKRYKLTRDGDLREEGDKWWYYCCTMKPSLPVNDIIAGTFTAVKNQTPLLDQTFKKRSNEEVKKDGCQYSIFEPKR